MPRRRNEELTDLHVLESTGENIRGRIDRLLKAEPNYFRTEEGLRDLQAALTDAKWHSKEAIKTARTSPVTGLRNRAALDSFLRQWNKKRANAHAGKGEVKEEAGITLVHFDLGSLKRVNDDPLLGYDYGDLMLKRTGRLLQLVSRAHGVPEEQVFHQGGDEFAVAVTGGESRERADSIARTLISIKNSLDFRYRSRDPEKAAIHRENSFKMGLATAGNSPKESLVELFKKSAGAAKVVGATTNHGYLHYDDLNSLSRSDGMFIDLITQSVNTRLVDDRLPVDNRAELTELLKNNELRLSRNNLRKALKLIGREERFDAILEKLPTVKGAELPDSRTRNAVKGKRK